MLKFGGVYEILVNFNYNDVVERMTQKLDFPTSGKVHSTLKFLGSVVAEEIKIFTTS